MAEEVKIVDVAGGPAAEATLQELLKTMKQMAAKSGTGAGAADEAKKQYNESIKKGTTVKKENTDATKENTSAVNKAANALGNLAGRAISGFTSIIGNGISIATNLFNAFGDGYGTLTDMISQVPIFGSLLAKLTGPFDDTLQSFQSLATSGATFNNSLTELRAAAAGAKVSLDTFAGFLAQNTEKLATFGGTVTQGAQAFGRARKAMQAYEQDLLGMGLTFEEINEGLADYMFITRAGSRAQRRDTAALAKSSAEYTKNLMTLSKLTGEDIKSQREKIAAQQADVAFQMKLATLRPEERDKINAGLAEAMAAGGETGAEFFKQQFLGMPPLTRQTQLFAATMPEAAAAIQQMSSQAMNAGVSFEQYQAGQVERLADFVEGAASAGRNLETLLAASASGLEGPGSEIAQILQGMGKQFTDYMDESGRFNRQALMQDIEAAQAENEQRDALVEGLTGFQNTLREIREAIELNIIGPIGRALGPQLVRIGELFKNTSDDMLKPAIDAIGDVLDNFIHNIETFGFGIALKNLLGDIGKAAAPVFQSIFSEIKALLFGQSAEEVQQEMQEAIDAIDAQEKRLNDRIAELRAQINQGGMTAPELDAARAEIAEYESQLISLHAEQENLRTGMEDAQETTGLLSGVFGSLWSKLSDMDWGKIALYIGGFTAALVGLGAVAKLVSPGLLAIGAAFGGIGLAGFGIAALIDSITNSMDTMADGLERMQELDPAKLLNVGESLGPLTENLMSLALGGVVASFISEGTFENLASGLSALAEVPGAAISSIGNGISNLGGPLLELAGSGIVLNFVGDNVFGNLADQLKKFENLNPQTLHEVGPALVALNQGIEAFTGGGVLESLGNAIGNFFSGLFGGNEFDDLVENLKKFEDVNTQKIYEVGQGLQGIANFVGGNIDVGDIQIGSRDLERLNTAMSSLDPSSVTSYSSALEDLVEVLTRLNEEMNEFTTVNVDGAASGGGGTTSAGALANIGGGSSDQQLAKLDQLNTTMMSLLTELRENTEFNRRISRVVRANGNLQA